MTEAILLLRLEHHHADDLLKLIELQLVQDAPVDLELLQSIVDYFAEYPDKCHHPIEDLIFQKLRAQDPICAAAVGNLLQEHERIAEVTKRVANTLREAVNDKDVQTTRLRHALRQFVDYYRAHMLAEERDFFPVALDLLSENDWWEIEFDLFDRRDPLFDRQVEERFRSLRDKVEKLARRSYRRGAFMRESKQLRQLASIQAFNDMMEKTGNDYHLAKHPEGGYGLACRGEVVIDIPKCSPTRAVWCAYFYVEAATAHGLNES